ncbi:MAG: hypothetical protein A2020_08325 [Lentisphaerae bacterium GWF2_45_14]|nr:MAG: hypothetical protein A2020_08325 [Lentisphaerae bacterium GWF2_45_14]
MIAKKIIRRISIAALAFASFSLPAQSNKGIPILNGDFEKTGHWSIQKTNAEISTEKAHSGLQSMKLTTTGSGYEGFAYSGNPAIKCRAETKYKLKFFILKESSNKTITARIRLRKGKKFIDQQYSVLTRISEGTSNKWKEYILEFTTSPETDNIIPDFYFMNAKDSAYIDDVSIEYIAPAPFINSTFFKDYLKKKLLDENYTLIEQNNKLIAQKDGYTSYYSINPEGKYMNIDDALMRAKLGAEVNKLNYKQEHILIGVSLYGYAIEKRAKELGMEKWDYISKIFDDLKSHSMNTIYYGNTGGNQEEIRKITTLAEARGLKLIMQISPAYYRCTEKEFRDAPEKRRKNYENINLPFVRDFIPQMKNNKTVLAWSIKEETRKEYAAEIAEYYNELRKLDPTHPILICHNNIDAAENMLPPYPDIMGFDRYYYRYVFGELSYLRTPSSAIETLIKQASEFYQASLKYKAPFFYYLQGVSTAVVNTDMNESLNIQMSDNALKRGWTFNKVTEKWSGWARYYPPKYCMKLQVWAALAIGAKGVICYNYGEPAWGKIKAWPPENTGIDSNEYTLAFNTEGNFTPQWDEYGEAAKEISRFSSLIVNINKRVINIATANNPNILLGTFQEENSDRLYLIAVNKKTGSWKNNSPESLSHDDVLSVDNTGNLSGYEAAGKLPFKLILDSDKKLFNLKNMKQVLPEATTENIFNMEMEPGDGNIYLIGCDNDFEACTEKYFNGVN